MRFAAQRILQGVPRKRFCRYALPSTFVVFKEGRYSLATVSEDYLLPSSPTYFGWFFDAWAPIYSLWSPESLLKAVMTDKPQGPFGDPNSAFASWHAEQALNFTRAITVRASRLVWPGRSSLIFPTIASCWTWEGVPAPIPLVP